MKGLIKITMWLCHLLYKKYNKPILYIRGYYEDYPRYLLYTEDEEVYKRMDKF